MAPFFAAGTFCYLFIVSGEGQLEESGSVRWIECGSGRIRRNDGDGLMEREMESVYVHILTNY